MSEAESVVGKEGRTRPRKRERERESEYLVRK